MVKIKLSEAIHADCPCGGGGRCGKCRVRVRGELSKPTENERRLLGGLIDEGWRLACQTEVCGDFELLESDESSSLEADQPLDTASLSISSDEPSHDKRARDTEKIRGELVIDIGTTTLEVRLITPDRVYERSMLNPQRRFGADVISRIGAAESHMAELTNELREALSSLTEGFEYERAVITGNTVMLHFLTGRDVSGMGHDPFTPSSLFGETIDGKSIGLRGSVYLPRCVSAFIGADTTCALICARLLEKGSLLVDLGTNGELAFFDGNELICASTAAGPALEGADISCGMRALKGAIDRAECIKSGSEVSISCHVLGEGRAKGLCGSGLISAVSALLEAELIDESGFVEGDIELAPGVSLTQADIRAFQLAKGAIRTGIDLICGGEPIKRLCVAGNFGRGLDIAACIRTGLLPECESFEVIGNAALKGAELLLRGEVEPTRISCRELALDENFDMLFCENMLFEKETIK